MVIDAPTPYSHFRRIRQVKAYIQSHVTEPLDRQRLADMAGYSISHFHRVFRAHVGVAISGYVRQVRLLRAAHYLRSTAVEVTDIALESGYETHSAFSKAFRQEFGVNPTAFRELDAATAAQLIDFRVYESNKMEKIDVIPEIKELPDLNVLYARATEVMTSSAFQTANIEASNMFKAYMDKRNLWPQLRHCVAIYPDEPVLNQEVRFDMGAIFADGTEAPAEDGMAYQTIDAGRWAIFTHVGPYDTLWQTWQAAYRDWLPTSDFELRDAIPFEDYIDNPASVAPADLRTEIYIPVV